MYSSGSYRVGCVFCNQNAENTTVCTKCYEGAKREIKDLKEKSDFLSLLSPGPSDNSSLSSTEITLEASDAANSSVLSVRAHKVILASRSATFRAMLESNMQESQTGIIKIKDTSFEALTSLVNFLYTAEVELDEQKARELLILADRYQVEHLKSYCERFFVGRMSWKTSLGDYAFALQYNAKGMQDAAINVIKDNLGKKVHENEGFKELLLNNPEALVKIYQAANDKHVDFYNSENQVSRPYYWT